MPKIPFTYLVEQQAHYRRLNRFVAQTLGSGEHILPLWEPTLVRVVYDDDDDDDIYFDVEIIDPIAPDISVTLSDVVEWVERTYDVIPNYDLPDATPSEDQALRTSIAKHGVKCPIILDENSQIIDGRRRKRIADDLRVPCPSISMTGLTLDQKRQLALELDLCRKHYSSTQKAVIIKNLLRWSSSESSRRIAALVGCDHKTVEKYRRELQGRGEIPQLDARIGKDGKHYPTRSVLANTENERIRAAKALQQLPPSCDNKIVDVTTAKRRAARNRNAAEREQKQKAAVPLAESAIRVYHCRFQNLESVAEIEPESVALISTDIPYDQEFLSQVEHLARSAKRMLRADGILALMTGKYWLHKVMEALNRHLNYRWIIDVEWDGEGTPVHLGGWKNPHGRIITRAKPILIYSKGNYSRHGQFCDVIHANEKEKTYHPHQQPLSVSTNVIEHFSDSGDLVVDPCGGGFTTAAACLRTNRRCISCDCEEEAVAIGNLRLKQEWQRIEKERRAD